MFVMSFSGQACVKHRSGVSLETRSLNMHWPVQTNGTRRSCPCIGNWFKSCVNHFSYLTCQEIQLFCHFGRKHYFGVIKMFLAKISSWKVVCAFVCYNRITKYRTELERWTGEKQRADREGWADCQNNCRLSILSFGFLSFPRMPLCSSCPLLLYFS